MIFGSLKTAKFDHQTFPIQPNCLAGFGMFGQKWLFQNLQNDTLHYLASSKVGSYSNQTAECKPESWPLLGRSCSSGFFGFRGYVNTNLKYRCNDPLYMVKKGSICHFPRALPASIWGHCSQILVFTSIWGTQKAVFGAPHASVQRHENGPLFGAGFWPLRQDLEFENTSNHPLE